MDLRHLLTPDRIVAALRVADKAQLLGELAGRAADATGLPQRAIQDGLIAREALGSTGIGGGVAIPHTRMIGLDHFFGLFARLERSLDFDSIDGQPVDLVCLLLVPMNAAHEHLQALACVSRPLRDPAITALLRRADTVSALHAALGRNGGEQDPGA